MAQRPSAGEMQHLAAQHAVPASCFLWKRAGGYCVCCYGPEGPIQCCGHGLLAAAYVLHQPQSLNGAEAPKIFLADSEQPVPVFQQSGALWLSLPRLRCTDSTVPEWASAAFGDAPVNAALAGGEQGYLVLEVAPDSDLLSRLERNTLTDAICANTRRALIITAPAQSKADADRGSSQSDGPVQGGSDFDYRTRYFAPQYGAAEDPVTGSAHRVLADYWSARLGKTDLRGLQCSAEGGVVLTRMLEERVAISGHLSLLQNL